MHCPCGGCTRSSGRSRAGRISRRFPDRSRDRQNGGPCFLLTAPAGGYSSVCHHHSTDDKVFCRFFSVLSLTPARARSQSGVMTEERGKAEIRDLAAEAGRSEAHTSELHSLMRTTYAGFHRFLHVLAPSFPTLRSAEFHFVLQLVREIDKTAGHAAS